MPEHLTMVAVYPPTYLAVRVLVTFSGPVSQLGGERNLELLKSDDKVRTDVT